MVTKENYHHTNLGDEISKKAFIFVTDNGHTQLSLRKIAKLCSVSPTAVYRHFKTKSHLYAEIVKKGFIEFDKHVNKNLGNNSRAVFVAAENYLDYAFKHRNMYDLIFSPTVIDFLDFPDVASYADQAFQTLLTHVKNHDPSLNDLSASNKAIKIWSFLHGLSSISKKMEAAMLLPENEMPPAVKSVKRTRENLEFFIQELF
tara:strand:- start:368 stop:973 length:606 start_codon:yes stop_codon:yes gene_type:complete